MRGNRDHVDCLDSNYDHIPRHTIASELFTECKYCRQVGIVTRPEVRSACYIVPLEFVHSAWLCPGHDRVDENQAIVSSDGVEEAQAGSTEFDDVHVFRRDSVFQVSGDM